MVNTSPAARHPAAAAVVGKDRVMVAMLATKIKQVAEASSAVPRSTPAMRWSRFCVAVITREYPIVEL